MIGSFPTGLNSMRVLILLFAAMLFHPALQTPTPTTTTLSTNQEANVQNAPPAGKNPTGTCTSKIKVRPGFLIIGTVFNENALAFPGTTIRVRCEEEKKFRWEAAANSRGEFAIRVPDGHHYQVVVEAKNYQPQSVDIRTENNDGQQRLSIRLQPLQTTKGGATP